MSYKMKDRCAKTAHVSPPQYNYVLSGPVGNEALLRVKSGQGIKLTTDFHVVQSAKVINEFKHAPTSVLIHGVIT